MTGRRSLRLLAGAVLVAAGLTSCTEPERDVVALLMPDSDTPRWEKLDRPTFEAAVRAECPDCVVEVRSAANSATTQSQQFDEVVAAGADVVVLVAVSGPSGEALITRAGDLPVVAYDRFVAGADHYVSFDNAKVGQLQAQALVDAAGKGASILRVNGGAGDPNTTAIRIAATPVLQKAKVQVLAELDPKDWEAETARDWVAEQIGIHGVEAIDGVLASNDDQAGGVAAAFKAAGARVPVLTGQDGELTALQRIITGRQTVSVYKSIREEATAAAQVAVQLLRGEAVTGSTMHEGVPAHVFAPIPVTRENLTNTVVRDGLVTIDELCPVSMQPYCERHGIW